MGNLDLKQSKVPRSAVTSARGSPTLDRQVLHLRLGAHAEVAEGELRRGVPMPACPPRHARAGKLPIAPSVPSLWLESRLSRQGRSLHTKKGRIKKAQERGRD
jgi:hypothetical protein